MNHDPDIIKSMFCPLCLNYSLHLATRGVATMIVNEKTISNGSFFFNVNHKHHEKSITENVAEKCELFFKLYSGFNNKEIIRTINLFSSDLICQALCELEGSARISVIDILIPRKQLIDIAYREGKKYDMEFDLIFD